MDASNESDTLFLAIRFGHTDQLREMLAANPALASAPLGGRYQTRAPLDIVTVMPAATAASLAMRNGSVATSGER